MVVWGKFQKVFQGSFKCVSRWRGVPRDLENFKGASQVSKRSSRQFQRHLKEVLGFFSVFKKISKKFQWCFKNVSMKFFLRFCCCKDLIAATRAEGLFGPKFLLGLSYESQNVHVPNTFLRDSNQILQILEKCFGSKYFWIQNIFGPKQFKTQISFRP